MSRDTERGTFKIGEVCRLADVQPYVLRYWETEFPSLAPGKGGGGQRAYTQREVDIILRIKQLLYTEGFTIAGAKKKLDVELASGKDLGAATAGENAVVKKSKSKRAATPVRAGVVAEVRSELQKILKMLD